MNKLKSKSDVIEWYWPDFLEFCMKTGTSYNDARSRLTLGQGLAIFPTVDNFWIWYITEGPLGLKQEGLYYTKEEVKYL